MSFSHLAKLFGAFGVILLVICVNTWLASQGGKAILSIPLISEERPAMCFFGLIMGSALLFLTSAVGSLFARRMPGKWPAKIPPVWLRGLNPAATETKVFQAGILIVLLGVPVACLLHLFDVVWTSKLCVLGTMDQPVMVSDHWFNGIAKASDQIRLVEDLLPNGTCGKGIQVFPGWEFSLVWLMLLASFLMTAFFLVQLLSTSWINHQTDASHRGPTG
jgi:hypothetical protein